MASNAAPVPFSKQGAHSSVRARHYPPTRASRTKFQALITHSLITMATPFPEPNKLCDFKPTKGRILKTVDSVYQDISSVEACKEKCLGAPYRCFSFDFGSDPSSTVCRTSHLDKASLSHIDEPYLDVPGAVTYELNACYNGKQNAMQIAQLDLHDEAAGREDLFLRVAVPRKSRAARNCETQPTAMRQYLHNSLQDPPGRACHRPVTWIAQFPAFPGVAEALQWRWR